MKKEQTKICLLMPAYCVKLFQELLNSNTITELGIKQKIDDSNLEKKGMRKLVISSPIKQKRFVLGLVNIFRDDNQEEEIIYC